MSEVIQSLVLVVVEIQCQSQSQLKHLLWLNLFIQHQQQ